MRIRFFPLVLLPVIFLVASLFAAGQQGRAGGAPENIASAKADQSPSSVSQVGLDLTPDAEGKLSQEQMQKLLRVVADKDIENDRRLRNYTYVERDVEKQLNGKGEIKSTEVKTFEVLNIYGEQVQRLREKDDQPLDAKEAAKEEEKIQKIIDKRKNESEDDRRKREEKADKDREESRKFVRDVADAYNFKLLGTELIGGREAWMIEAEPRPGFEPQVKESKFLAKFHGRVWIDKSDLQLSKMEVEAIDTVSVGWVLARIHKGTRVMLEQTQVNEEVWLPRHVTFNVDARFALVKGFKVDGDQTFRDYKKFRTSSRIVGMGEVQEEKEEPKQAPK